MAKTWIAKIKFKSIRRVIMNYESTQDIVSIVFIKALQKTVLKKLWFKGATYQILHLLYY